MTVIEVARGDILAADTDYIVNPANSFLRHGGGLAALIERVATTIPDDVLAGEDCDVLDAETAVQRWKLDHATRTVPVATGNVHVTRPGLLPFEAVIHAVGPIWNGGTFYEATLLIRTMRSILFAAEDLGGGSVAVPAISCGVFGFPVDRAAELLVRAAYAHPGRTGIAPVERVRFVPFSEEDAEAFGRAMACVFDRSVPSLLV